MWLGIEVWLSHTPGAQSGEQSKWLVATTHISEKSLQSLAYVFLFLLLSLFAAAGFGVAGVAVSAVWAVLDEATKPLVSGWQFS